MSNPRHTLASLLHRLGVVGPARVCAFQGIGAPARCNVLAALVTVCSAFGVLLFAGAAAQAAGLGGEIGVGAFGSSGPGADLFAEPLVSPAVTHTVTVVPTGSGAGSVSAEAAQTEIKDCAIAGGVVSGVCTGSFDEGSTVLLVTTLAGGSTVAWSGCSSLIGNTCDITVGAGDITVTATFTAPVTDYTLAVNTSGGTGSGAVKCEVGGGSPTVCAHEYPEGAELTLVPIPGAGSEFGGFSGGAGSAAGCAGISSCTFTIGADSSINAPFDLQAGQDAFVLSTSGGTGTGKVECDGGACASTYHAGETITLTDVPGANSSLASWSVTGSGATVTPCAGDTSPCEVEMAGNVTVDATFSLNTHTLTVAPAGAGSGSVSAISGGVENCAIAGGVLSGTCSSSYEEGATVILTAIPAAHDKVEWNGCVSSSGDACRVEMAAADATVTATFTALPKTTSGGGGVRTEIGSIGPGGPGVGVFSEPQSVAVEQNTEDIFVYDTGEGGRIYKFNAAGEPQDFSGLGATAHPNVIEGIGGSEGQIAVDSSSGPDKGDIYVATGSKVLIYSATGAKLATFTQAKVTFSGVAVDPGGALYVSLFEDGTQEVAIRKYTPVTNPVTTADYTSSLWEVQDAGNIAVDSAGDVYLAAAAGVIKYEASQFRAQNPEELPAEGTVFDAQGGATSVAVDPSPGGNVYIDEESDIAEYSSSGQLVESFGELGGSFGVAVSHTSEDVYVTDGEESEVVIFARGAVLPEVRAGAATDRQPRSVTLNGTVNPEETEVTACEFEYGSTTSYGHSEACSPPAPFSGNSPVAVSASVDGLEPDTAYDFRLAATNANGTRESAGSFTTAGVRLDQESAGNIASSSADLLAQIDPRGGDTSYYFQYGPTSGYGTSVPAASGIDIGSGEADVSVVQHVQGLEPSSTYHYRVVVVQGAEVVDGPDQTFTTPASGEVLTLLDGREWEMVSPVNKHGADIVKIEVGVVQAAEDGGALTYLTNGAIEAEPAGNAEASQELSTRGPSGWSSKDIANPHQTATTESLGLFDYWFFSSDLSRGVIDQYGPATPLVPGVVGHTLYMRALPGEEFVALVNNENVPPGSEGYGGDSEAVAFQGPQFEGATPDLSHVVLRATLGGVNGLYEWTAGKLELVSEEAELGGQEARNAVSSDGSRVFYSSKGHLYLRDMVKGEMLQVDAVKGGSGAGAGDPVFQAASSDGSRVFFTDAQRLTADAGTAPESVDLYACDVVEEAGRLACRLSDLTADAGESPGLQGRADTVIAAGEDGSYVYFVADGALPGTAASAGNCSGAGGEIKLTQTCNLYVAHYDGSAWSTRLIGVLSGADASDWAPLLSKLTARVSPDGEWFAFMSDRSLTGYDNRDLNSDEPDEEMFLYNAASGRLVCASCNPTGGRPTGVEANQNMLVEGYDVEESGVWVAAKVPGWIALNGERSFHQDRYLSDSGRLFFDSSDALVPQDVNGTWDVYEYEPDEVGSCARAGGCVGLISGGTSAEESAFLEASASGDDVFFLTAAKLTTGDLDTAYDVYDAHACSASSPCFVSAAGSPACVTADSCRAAPAPAPAIFGPSGSATFSGQGNIGLGGGAAAVGVAKKAKALTRAQKLARALKTCKREPKRKRAGCDRRARKRYGPVKASRGSRGQARKHSGGRGKAGR